jgi:hypothetical protein
MSVEMEIILARARKSIEELERLSGIAERLAKETKPAPVSQEQLISPDGPGSQPASRRELPPKR